jgi:hypothetical protein
MTIVKTILESYERTGSYRKTAREVGVAHNTVKRYVLRAQAAREGTIDAIVPETREIIQPCRVVTDEIRGKSIGSSKTIGIKRRNSGAMPS